MELTNPRLKKLVADLTLDKAVQQVRRVLPAFERQTCQVLGQHRSTYYPPSKMTPTSSG